MILFKHLFVPQSCVTYTKYLISSVSRLVGFSIFLQFISKISLSYKIISYSLLIKFVRIFTFFDTLYQIHLTANML